tara:strand:- start:3689 stop:4042 length:354 start_codon:yes stop_codon:yes gene_type:complete
MIEVEITANCEVCEEKLDVDYGAVITCCACYDKRFDHTDIHEAIIYSAQHDYHWEDPEGYSDFESEEHLAMFMKGVKHGYASALFWLCDHMGMVEFFEDEIGHDFKNVKGAKSREKR